MLDHLVLNEAEITLPVLEDLANGTAGRFYTTISGGYTEDTIPLWGLINISTTPQSISSIPGAAL